ncbi:Transferase [Macleaya cordata]|uniref:Transferase n=1 Tax=Macleaya cordata TaxID=56857 RepID=A0A200RDG9_MACCD|nr:Transferase [Macleaya cordata]
MSSLHALLAHIWVAITRARCLDQNEQTSFRNLQWLIFFNGSVSTLLTGGSLNFNIYGNDFGWGRPVAVRSGFSNQDDGKITVFAGLVEGSVDIEACFYVETLKAMENDAEFMEAVTVLLPNFQSV